MRVVNKSNLHKYKASNKKRCSDICLIGTNLNFDQYSCLQQQSIYPVSSTYKITLKYPAHTA